MNKIIQFADKYNIDPKLLVAIIKTESIGSGIDKETGRPTIRFELHVFIGMLSSEQKAESLSVFSFGAKRYLDHYYRGVFYHTDQNAEYKAFLSARLINNDAALQSTSYGFSQLMGFNYELLGYADAYDMYLASYKEENQFDMFFSFLINRTGMLRALQAGNLELIAEYYNGAGNVENYVVQLKKYL